jgi:hypothetical protein
MTFLVIEDGEEKGKIEEARLNRKINNLILTISSFQITN